MTYLLLRKMEESLPKLPMFRLSQESEEHLDYCKAYVSGGLIRILIEWFQNDFEPGIEELSALAEDLISGKIFQDLM